jgi:hypothetical protein
MVERPLHPESYCLKQFIQLHSVSVSATCSIYVACVEFSDLKLVRPNCLVFVPLFIEIC